MCARLAFRSAPSDVPCVWRAAAGSSFATIPQVDVNLDANTNQIRSDFNSYVSQVAGMVSEAREKAERDIMGK